MLEVVSVWLAVNGVPVNSLQQVLQLFGMAVVTSLDETDLPQIDEASMFVALDSMQLVLGTPGFEPLRLLGLERGDLVEACGADQRIDLWIGEDFGLKTAVTSGTPLDVERVREAIAGRRLLGGTVICR